MHTQDPGTCNRSGCLSRNFYLWRLLVSHRYESVRKRCDHASALGNTGSVQGCIATRGNSVRLECMGGPVWNAGAVRLYISLLCALVLGSEHSPCNGCRQRVLCGLYASTCPAGPGDRTAFSSERQGPTFQRLFDEENNHFKKVEERMD